MMDVVREIELDERVEQARAQAIELAERHVERVEQQCASARRCYDAGDDAASHGWHELAERLWYAGALLAGVYDDEIADVELVEPGLA